MQPRSSTILIRLASTGLFFALSLPALAEERLQLDTIDLGAKTWLSTGETSWNHTSPAFGDPTSELEYKSLDALIFEMNTRIDFNNEWMLRGRVGIGEIRDGELRDRDWLSPATAEALGEPQLFSDTTSTVDDDDSFYAGIDLGMTFIENSSMRIEPYLGYEYWREKVVASGINQRVGFLGNTTGQVVSPSVAAISNEVEWHSFKVGLASAFFLAPKWTLNVDAALIPYSRMHNEDEHLLRTDLARDLSIEMDGHGYGGQLEMDLTYQATENVDLSVGARYWTMYSDGDIRFYGRDGSVSPDLDLNDFDSDRYGLTAGINMQWE